MSDAKDSLLERAVSLFEFLARAQQMLVDTPRTIDSYLNGGAVFWLADLPEHAAVNSALSSAAPDPASPVLAIEKIPRVTPPSPPAEIREALAGVPLDKPDLEPRLAAGPSQISDGPLAPEFAATRAPEPHIVAAFDVWLADWRRWADRELRDRPARALYARLFETYLASTERADELELVVGVGCLSWAPERSRPIMRHVLTAPARAVIDDVSGTLEFFCTQETQGVKLELDMVDDNLIANPLGLNVLREEVREQEGFILDRAASGQILKRLANALDPEAEHVDEDLARRPSPAPATTFAPALILRKRSTQGLVEIFQTIARQLEGSSQVPAGLLPLLDPDYSPPTSPIGGDGAVLHIDGEVILPMPLNEVQLKVINRVDTHAQTVVQGPPGTGKTHTAAALLTHLLAQGKRVLVTAKSDQALKEVRAKLPEAIKPLSVAVVGSSQDDMADLKVAVARISHESTELEPAEEERKIEFHLKRIDQLRRERASTFHMLRLARESETAHREHAGYAGTLARIAQACAADQDRFGWLLGYVYPPSNSHPPLTSAEATTLLTLHRDVHLTEDEHEARLRLVEPDLLPDPKGFAELCRGETDADSARQDYSDKLRHEAYEVVRELSADAREGLRARMHGIARQAAELERRHSDWLNEALRDVRAHRGRPWESRAAVIGDHITHISPYVERLGTARVAISADSNVAVLDRLARSVRDHIISRGPIKTNPDGTPKLGPFTSSVLKQAKALFDSVRVNGLPPVTVEQIDAFLTHNWVDQQLQALDAEWPMGMSCPPEDTLRERLEWHLTELEQLRHVVRFGAELLEEEQNLTACGLPAPNWNDLHSVREYASLVDAAAAHEAWRDARQPLEALASAVGQELDIPGYAPVVSSLSIAIQNRDIDGYRTAYERHERLLQVRLHAANRDELDGRLSDAAPSLAEAIRTSPSLPDWEGRLPHLDEAWRWASTRSWLREQESIDVNALQQTIDRLDEDLRSNAERLAAIRAWKHAVAPDRISGTARADLTQYAQLVRRLGKGTGKYAARRQAEIRQAMDRCRPAVPVWIMPIYRIAEQLSVQQNMFDVVVVDEASQAGLEATFLQYLAPKIVVIGDDKQVSPSAVGIDEEKLRSLANQYLPHDRYKASWQDPKRSLFDEAIMRYGGRLTLVEHRRCVPEIIGFSNRIAYEPDNIRLIPVRQYGADRLPPIRVVHVKDGYVKGTTAKINPPEAERIADQIQGCIEDPHYAGLTFGVISLQGAAQAKQIESLLLDRISAHEWAARELRCGDAPDFQGSERDVIFLSMVAAPDPGKRIGAMTKEMNVQRYNVAASRAKDQLWVFHSITPEDISRSDDMRFQLLDYCYGIVNRAGDETPSALAVSNDDRVEPFDSLFEQRVYNQLVQRGYTVVPQYEAQGYRIDLVVIGAHTRLAVECDGDHWHGPAAYESDLRRQRELERCGWHFHRIRESAYYLDTAHAVAELQDALFKLEIRPIGWEPPGLPPESGELEEPTEQLETVHSEIRTPVNRTNEILEPDLVRPTTPPIEPGSSSDCVLPPYQEFEGELPHATEASTTALIDGIREIVAIEGPVMGSRIWAAYIGASNQQRVGKNIRATLTAAIKRAVTRKILVREDPLDTHEIKDSTFYLPGQGPVHLRQRGPRGLEQVPPTELATLLEQAAAEHGWDDLDWLYREVLSKLGRSKLTASTREILDRALSLTRREQ